jgi:hypothetical protein
MLDRVPPSEHIMERRRLFAWAKPTPKVGEGRSERDGEIDQDVCDGIGQLHILGLLDGHGHDALDLRNAGRFYGEHYWRRYQDTAPNVSKYERSDRSTGGYLGESAADRKFDRMDGALQGYEREVLMSLVVDRAWGDEIVPWALALIHEGLRERGKFVKCGMFPSDHERGLLAALVRALCVIHDGGLEMRRAA